jgi:hypothetical protein
MWGGVDTGGDRPGVVTAPAPAEAVSGAAAVIAELLSR